MDQDQSLPQPTTEFDAELADDNMDGQPLKPAAARAIFDYFRNCPLFRWGDANNDCEDRANAIGILLDVWGIANAKGWVFSGDFRRKEQGQLTNLWNYHVAGALPVKDGERVVWYVIDPATSQKLIRVDEWAAAITQGGKSYHFVKRGWWYIFPSGLVTKDNWYMRNRRNHNWTMQGLSGINGVSATGRAQLAFCKTRVQETTRAFQKLKAQNPFSTEPSPSTEMTSSD